MDFLESKQLSKPVTLLPVNPCQGGIPLVRIRSTTPRIYHIRSGKFISFTQLLFSEDNVI